jgi:hypothetical protein
MRVFLKRKTAPEGAALQTRSTERLALAGLEAGVGLVDDVNPALAAHDTAILVAGLYRLQRMADFHDVCSWFCASRRPSAEALNSMSGGQ